MFNDDTQEEVVVEEAEVEEEVEVEEEDTTDWKAIALEEKAKREKAEQTIIKNKQKPKVVAAEHGLSTTDIIALSKADIQEEDLDEVLDFAKRKEITVREALKHPVLKATLQVLGEERKSAEAVATPGRRGATNLTDAQVLAMGDKGEIPEALMGRYAELRLKNKSR